MKNAQEKNVAEGKEENLSSINIDDSLEDRLKAHGISKRNVRSIIHEIFSDKNVLKLLNPESDDPEFDFPDVPITRSKKLKTDETTLDDDLFLADYGLEDYGVCEGRSCTYTQSEAADEYAAHDSVYLDSDQAETCNLDVGNFDWQLWLSDFNEDKQDGADDREEDSEDDPDFNFLAELEEPDAEDYRNDCATRISKKELRSLNHEKQTFANTKQKKTFLPEKGIHTEKKPVKKSSNVTSFSRCKTLKEKIALMRSKKSLANLSENFCGRQRKTTGIVFTSDQKGILKQQMEQHLQLLMQTCVLDWSLTENFNQASIYLHELDLFKNESPSPALSHFNVPHLNESLCLLHQMRQSAISNDSMQNVDSKYKRRMMVSNKRIFVYKQFIPDLTPPNSPKRKKFSASEDSLIAHGLSEMSGFYMSVYELIAALLLPIYTSQEISKRVKSVMSTGTYSGTKNPIYQFKFLGVLPRRNKHIKKVCKLDEKGPVESNCNINSSPGELQDYNCSCVEGTSDIQQGPDVLNVGAKRTSVELSGCEVAGLSAKNVKLSRSGKLKMCWTRAMDEKILHVCKEHGGPTQEALSSLVTSIPGSNKKKIKKRFHELSTIYQCKLKKENSCWRK